MYFILLLILLNAIQYLIHFKMLSIYIFYVLYYHGSIKPFLLSYDILKKLILNFKFHKLI